MFNHNILIRKNIEETPLARVTIMGLRLFCAYCAEGIPLGKIISAAALPTGRQGCAVSLGRTTKEHMRLITIITISILFLSCSKSPTSIDTNTHNRVQLTYTSADTLEAQDLALWATAQLVASDSAVTEMLYRINYLRYYFKDSMPFKSFLNSRFLPPWTTTSIAIKFDSATAVLVRNRSYTGWSLLPSEVKADSITPPDVLGWSFISYSQHRNPWRLCEIYVKLPGVVYCEPNGIGFTDGTFPIFPGTLNGQMSYLFVEGYSYMPSAYHFFYYQNNQPIYAGIWSNQQSPKPSWWQDAKTSIDSFYYWGKYK